MTQPIFSALFLYSLTMILLPDNIPAGYVLRKEGFDARFYSMEKSVEEYKGTHLLVYFLNLMPDKQATELDIFRKIAASGKDVKVVPVRIPGQKYKTTPQIYVEKFYTDIVPLMSCAAPDGLIVTGAPLEQIPLPDVRYWGLLRNIMEWAKGAVCSTLYICWAAQAALAHFFGVRAQLLPSKRFGIYLQKVKKKDSPLMSGLGRSFPMPVSRHAQVIVTDAYGPWFDILADNPESGLGVASTHSLRSVFVTGHLEYGINTLDSEYRRDLSKNLPIQPPINYYQDDDAGKAINFSWAKAADTFYRNWLDVLSIDRNDFFN